MKAFRRFLALAVILAVVGCSDGHAREHGPKQFGFMLLQITRHGPRTTIRATGGLALVVGALVLAIA